MTGERLLTVGQGLGAYGGVDVEGSTVRLGAHYVELTGDEYGMWLLSLGVESVDRLYRLAAEYEYPDVDALVARLVERELLVRYHPATELRAVLTRHRLVAQGYGVGNSDQEPAVFTVASLDGSPRIGVGRYTYSVWSASWLTSLWTLCEGVAAQAGEPLDDVVRQVSDELPLLIGCQAGLLDRVH